jgi:hypothetical protein
MPFCNSVPLSQAPIIDFNLDHGKEATEALKAFIGDYYTFSDKPVFQALWENYNRCQFVDDEGRAYRLQFNKFC